MCDFMDYTGSIILWIFTFTIHLLLKVYTDLLESMWEGVEKWDSDENLESEDNEGEEYE